MATELFTANRATTTVSSGGTTAPAPGTQESWTVASSALFGAAATGVSQFHVADPAAPSEVIAVTNVSGTTWTVTRGAESTTPVTHVSGFTVYQVATAGFLASPVFSGAIATGGLTGATAASRYVGATTAGAPVTGTFITGDWIVDQTGVEWVCTSGGSPGTWSIMGAQTLRDIYLRSPAIIGETTPRSSMLNTGVTLTSGTLQMAAVALPAGTAVGHLQFASSTAENGPTHWWFGLFDSSRVMLAVTADQTSTAWGNSTYKSLAVATIASGASATFTTTYTGLHYVGAMMAAGTAITLLSGGQASTAVTGQVPILCGTSNAGQTTPPAFPFTASTITATSNVVYGAVAT